MPEPSVAEMRAALKASPSVDEMRAALKASQEPEGTASGNKFLDEHPVMKEMVKGAIGDLPTVGGLVGGAVGAGAGGPVGAVAGAGLGGATGSAAGDVLNKLVFGKDKTAVDTIKDAATEGVTQGAFQGAGEAIPAVTKIPAVKNLAAKAGEAIFKVPAEVIKTYAENAKKIKAMYSSNDGNIAAAADTVKTGFMSELDEFRQSMGQKISQALQGSDKTISAEPILNNLEKTKASLNKVLHKDQIQNIDDLMGQVKELGGDSGEIPISEANQLKEHFQTMARDAYRSPGEIFQSKDKVAQAAKSGGAITRKLINEAAPQVAEANEKLAALHTIEDNMNSSLLSSGKTESSLVAAGKGSNQANQLALEKLSELTGKDFVGPAKDLAAAQVMGNASFTPGRGQLAGAALGGVIGGRHGNLSEAAAGAAAGGIMTSPRALKSMIDAGLLATKTPQTRNALTQGVIRGTRGVNNLVNPSEPTP